MLWLISIDVLETPLDYNRAGWVASVPELACKALT